MSDHNEMDLATGAVRRLQVDGKIYEVRKPTMELIMSALRSGDDFINSFLCDSTRKYKLVKAECVRIGILGLIKVACIMEEEIAIRDAAHAEFIARMNIKLDEMLKQDEGEEANGAGKG